MGFSIRGVAVQGFGFEVSRFKVFMGFMFGVRGFRFAVLLLGVSSYGLVVHCFTSGFKVFGVSGSGFSTFGFQASGFRVRVLHGLGFSRFRVSRFGV